MAADLSAFSNQVFDPAQWINSTIAERTDDEPLETFLASLAMKLHIISQDYTDQLETGMVEATTIMPRIIGEVSRIEDVLKSLEAEMSSLTAQIQEFDQRNVAGVEDLSRLNTLKSNIEKCKATLEEHARWSQVVREARTFMEGGGRLSDSADRLEIMFRSCEVLQNMPGHEERLCTCDSFRDSLLSALRPRMQHDVTTADLSPLHEYLYVYDKLSKRDEFEEEYSRARPQRLRAAWATYQSGEPFLPWFSGYLSRLVQFFSDEFEQMKILFGDSRAPTLLCQMIKHAMDPTRTELSDRLKLVGQPDVISEAYIMADKIVTKLSVHLEDVDSSLLFDALDSFFGGFVEFMENYVEVESKTVKDALAQSSDEIVFQLIDSEIDEFGDPDRDVLQIFEAFSERLLRIIDGSYHPLNLSVKRSASFMSGIKVKPIYRSLSTTLIQFVKLLLGKIEELRVALGFEAQQSGSKATSVDGEKGNVADDVKLAVALAWHQKLKDTSGNVLGSSEGRQLLPCILRVLQSVGRLVQRVFQLDEESCLALHLILSTIYRDGNSLDRTSLSANSSLGTSFCYLFLQQDLTASTEFKGFISSLARNPNQTSVRLTTSPGVFNSAIPSINKLKMASGCLLFDLCTAFPRKLVSEVSSDEVWAVGKLEVGSSVVDSSDRFDDNALPQQLFTQLGEHMLSLVQDLETFASSNALPDLLKLTGLGDTDLLVVRDWKVLANALDLREDEKIENLSKRSICINSVIASEKAIFGAAMSNFEGYETAAVATNTQGSQSFDSEDVDGSEAKVALSMTFVNEWLGAIVDSIVGVILAQIVQITVLSPSGRAQLEVDVSYLSNVINALGLRPHPLLVHTLHILCTEPSNLVSSIDSVSSRLSISGSLKKFDKRIVDALSVGHGIAAGSINVTVAK